MISSSVFLNSIVSIMVNFAYILATVLVNNYKSTINGSVTLIYNVLYIFLTPIVFYLNIPIVNYEKLILTDIKLYGISIA
jgi:hypothetical protein